MADIIAYIRVSTTQQWDSGLGLDAQREAVSRFASLHDMRIVAEYSDAQTGKGADALSARPGLANAMAHAEKIKAPVVVAKLDRLSRDVHYISGLMARGIDFIAADLGPNVRTFMLHIYAAVAQEERRMISERTKAALGALKAKGAKLGNPRIAEAQAASREAKRDTAKAFAVSVAPHIADLRNRGVTKLADIATELNKLKGAEPPRGGQWHASTVCRLLKRI